MKLTPEQRMTKARVRLMTHPLFCALSGIMMMGKVTITEEVETACTNGRDEEYNPKFMEQLNDEDHGQANIILLDSFKARMEWIELKEKAFEHYREWEPDGVLIEKKATGAPLIYEFRAMGIPAQEFTPGKGSDKISRLNSVSDLIASGKVWVPETRWAEELVDEIASFPSGEHDDLVDATTLALARFRQGGFIRLPSDEPEEIKWFKGRRDQERFYNV